MAERLGSPREVKLIQKKGGKFPMVTLKKAVSQGHGTSKAQSPKAPKRADAQLPSTLLRCGP